ncbi:MAG: glycosyl hydrolase [Acidobacteriota bacterium]
MRQRSFLCAMIGAVTLLAAFVPGCRQEEQQDALFAGFQNPPAQARPFVRWWWNGNRVTTPEALRELDLLAAAGVGGVEINPIAMPQVVQGDPEEIAPALEWLSPEWNAVVKAVAEETRERGMIADIIIGSGWPFGGRFLQPGEQLQLVTVHRETLRGPQTYTKSLSELTRGTFRTWDPVRRHEVTEGSPPKLLFLRLVPKSEEPAPGLELLPDAVHGDKVVFEVPAGDYELYAGSWREGFRQVELGAPGADGPVVDHFAAQAVRAYLDRMSGGLEPDLGRPLGRYFRAVFCDSLELGEANWTGDFVAEFQRRRGYDPWPWIHYMVENGPVPGDGEKADHVRRLRYDFNLTLAELFEEQFLDTLRDWAREHGVRARVQAYGRETRSVDSALHVDLPEGESWIWGSEKLPHPTVSNRFTASAAHLVGRQIVSAESMTNTTTVFRTLPYQLKQLGDLTFLSGVNHFILHGFNYSPPEAGFPGWVRFGTYFSEHNPWWPYLRLWADYAARISWVLQNSTPVCRVAILAPDTDVWSEFGRPYYPFPEREAPILAWKLWEPFHQAGFNVDYLSDWLLQEMVSADGRLRYGEREYELLVVPNLLRMTPKAAERLLAFAESGGRILFVGRVPRQGPSYADLGEGDARVRRTMERLQAEFSGTVRVVQEPPAENAAAWAQQAAADLGLTPDVILDPASGYVSQLHQRSGDREIFFFVNSNPEASAELTAAFSDLAGRTARRWDPETGERQLYPGEIRTAHYEIQLEPLESLLLVFETEAPPPQAPRWQEPVEAAGTHDIVGPWRVVFRHAVTGDEWVEEWDVLEDIPASPDERRQTFAGSVEYETTFTAPSGAWNWLDLGVVHGVSQVWLNDRDLGVRWYGRHRFALGGALRGGENRLRIRVTTHLGNYVRGLRDNPVAQRWASWFPLEALGLLGPVELR